MRDPELQRRIDTRLEFQEREMLEGKELRELAFSRLFKDHQDMDPEQFESWLELLESEEDEPIPNLSAGVAALAMMDVRDSLKKGYPSYHVE